MSILPRHELVTLTISHEEYKALRKMARSIYQDDAQDRVLTNRLAYDMVIKCINEDHWWTFR